MDSYDANMASSKEFERILFSNELLYAEELHNMMSFRLGGCIRPFESSSQYISCKSMPILCLHCSSFFNKYCTIIGESSQWTCSICNQKNISSQFENGGYKSFPELNNESIQYIDDNDHYANDLIPNKSSSMTHIFAIDSNLCSSEDLDKFLIFSFESLPNDSKIGMYIFGRSINIFRLCGFGTSPIAVDTLPGEIDKSNSFQHLFQQGEYITTVEKALEGISNIISAIRCLSSNKKNSTSIYSRPQKSVCSSDVCQSALDTIMAVAYAMGCTRNCSVNHLYLFTSRSIPLTSTSNNPQPYRDRKEKIASYEVLGRTSCIVYSCFVDVISLGLHTIEVDCLDAFAAGTGGMAISGYNFTDEHVLQSLHYHYTNNVETFPPRNTPSSPHLHSSHTSASSSSLSSSADSCVETTMPFLYGLSSLPTVEIRTCSSLHVDQIVGPIYASESSLSSASKIGEFLGGVDKASNDPTFVLLKHDMVRKGAINSKLFESLKQQNIQGNEGDASIPYYLRLSHNAVNANDVKNAIIQHNNFEKGLQVTDEYIHSIVSRLRDDVTHQHDDNRHSVALCAFPRMDKHTNISFTILTRPQIVQKRQGNIQIVTRYVNRKDLSRVTIVNTYQIDAASNKEDYILLLKEDIWLKVISRDIVAEAHLNDCSIRNMTDDTSELSRTFFNGISFQGISSLWNIFQSDNSESNKLIGEAKAVLSSIGESSIVLHPSKIIDSLLIVLINEFWSREYSQSFLSGGDGKVAITQSRVMQKLKKISRVLFALREGPLLNKASTSSFQEAHLLRSKYLSFNLDEYFNLVYPSMHSLLPSDCISAVNNLNKAETAFEDVSQISAPCALEEISIGDKVSNDTTDQNFALTAVDNMILNSWDEVEPDTLNLFPNHLITFADLGDHIVLRFGCDVEDRDIIVLEPWLHSIAIKFASLRYPSPEVHLISSNTPQERLLLSRLNPSHMDRIDVIRNTNMPYNALSNQEIENVIQQLSYTDQMTYMKYMGIILPKFSLALNKYIIFANKELLGDQGSSSGTYVSPPAGATAYGGMGEEGGSKDQNGFGNSSTLVSKYPPPAMMSP